MQYFIGVLTIEERRRSDVRNRNHVIIGSQCDSNTNAMTVSVIWLVVADIPLPMTHHVYVQLMNGNFRSIEPFRFRFYLCAVGARAGPEPLAATASTRERN